MSGRGPATSSMRDVISSREKTDHVQNIFTCHALSLAVPMVY